MKGILKFVILMALCLSMLALAGCKKEHVHTPMEAVNENEVSPTCTEAGSYDSVIYCSGCERELSRITKTVEATGHSEGAPAEENRKDPTCTEAGSYDTVTRCTKCSAVLHSTTTPLASHGHTEGTATEENRVNPTCTAKGSYDEVVKCTVCGEELSRVKKEIKANGHTESEPVIENEGKPTCTGGTSYDSVIYCSVCDAEISRTNVPIDANGHTNGTPTRENEQPAGCTVDGSYDMVTRCTVCGEIVSKTTHPIDATGHTEGEPVIENEVPATCLSDGSYDVVIRCANCHTHEISRTTEIVEKGQHNTVEGVCTHCGAKESTAGLLFEPTPDGKNYILKGLGDCQSASIYVGTYMNRDVVEIAALAFENNTTLSKVEIGASVTNIGTGAFRNASKIASYQVASANTVYKSVDGILYSKDGKTLIQYAIGKTSTSFKIAVEVTTIAEGAFYGARLESITLRVAIRVIEKDAFGGCAKLKKVFYASSAADWDSKVTVESGNDYLLDAKRTYNSDGDILLPPAPIV